MPGFPRLMLAALLACVCLLPPLCAAQQDGALPVGQRRRLADADPQAVGKASLQVGENPDVKRALETGAALAGLEAVQAAGPIRSPPGEAAADIPATTVLGMTTLMASATALGALPFFVTGSLSKEWAALASAVACGVMLACSFDLMHEGQPYGGGLVVLGILLGSLFISASQRWLERFEDVKFQGLQGLSARKILLMIGIMAAHAFGEGAGVGVSFCGSRGWAQGVLVTLAIGLHNVPEGLAVATVLCARGIPAKRALLWTLFTAAPQPLVALPAFLFVDAFRALLPVALGFAAGCMVWMVFAELLPDALADAPHAKVATVGTFAAAWLEGLRMLLATLEDGSSGALSLPPQLSGRTAAAGALLLAAAAGAGVAGGRLARPLLRDPASGFGLAGGLLACQAALRLLGSLRQTGSPGPTLTAAAAALGAGGVLLLRSRVLTAAGQPKQKTGATPVKQPPSMDAVEQGLTQGLNGFHPASEQANGLPGDAPKAAGARLFAPYSPDAKRQAGAPHLQLGAAVLAAAAAAEGLRQSGCLAPGAFSLAGAQGALTLRALVPGAAAAALLPGGGWAVVGAAAALGPAVGFAEMLRREVGGGGARWPLVISAAGQGAALAGGGLVLYGFARQWHWKRATRGLLAGLAASLAVHLGTGLLWWGALQC